MATELPPGNLQDSLPTLEANKANLTLSNEATPAWQPDNSLRWWAESLHRAFDGKPAVLAVDPLPQGNPVLVEGTVE